MKLVIDRKATSSTYVTFFDKSGKTAPVSASRGLVQDALRRAEKDDKKHEVVQGLKLSQDEIKALIKAMDVAAQEVYDVALEKHLDRAEQFDTNWE